MGNIKKFMKYFLPAIAISLLFGNFISAYTSIIAGKFLGSTAISAMAASSNLIAIAHRFISIVSIASLLLAAVLAERGKVRAARKIHLTGLIVFCSYLMLEAIILFAVPTELLKLLNTPAEVMSMGRDYLRIYALVLPLLIPAAVLPSQLSGKHSFILVMALGAGMWIVSFFLPLVLISILNMGISSLAISNALSFTVFSAMPFLMVPVKSYSKAFAPSIPE